MVKVEFYETASRRKASKGKPEELSVNLDGMKDGEIRGVFFVNIIPTEIPEIDEALTEEQREIAIKKRDIRVEEAKLDCKFLACDVVRNLVGPEGVLVASIIDNEKEVKGK